LAIVARVPPASTGLLLVIAMHDCGHAYATACACRAAVATGMALGSPFVGRLIDRPAQTTVLLATAVVAFAAMAAFAVAPRGTPTFARSCRRSRSAARLRPSRPAPARSGA
jgi:predicted MFS family arabinose efflux permease